MVFAKYAGNLQNDEMVNSHRIENHDAYECFIPACGIGSDRAVEIGVAV